MVRRMAGGIGFDDDIVGLFTDGDRQCMRGFGLDLSDWWGVRQKADVILRRIEADDMPPSSENRPWSDEMKALFRRWVEEGAPKYRAEKQVAYFSSIDNRTEYEDPKGSGLMTEARFIMSTVLQSWREFAEATDPVEVKEELEELREHLETPDIREAVEKLDDMLCEETERHYLSPENGSLDVVAILDTFENFGRDRFSEDTERAAKFPDHYDPLNHRMDSTSMWFYWGGAT